MTLWIIVFGTEIWRRDYHELKKSEQSIESESTVTMTVTQKRIQVIIALREICVLKKNSTFWVENCSILDNCQLANFAPLHS